MTTAARAHPFTDYVLLDLARACVAATAMLMIYVIVRILWRRAAAALARRRYGTPTSVEERTTSGWLYTSYAIGLAGIIPLRLQALGTPPDVRTLLTVVIIGTGAIGLYRGVEFRWNRRRGDD